jgi:phenylpropionate dioxygenase-like ring-hydroxylating dioxygenase large terminal subunit/AcrR family transcriptional regulator
LVDRTQLKKPKMARPPAGGRASSGRQRLRLINACISALHIHGPSRTTVEKVVSIAGMSPGIVRFYFASKASMLVASLEYLSAEFEERVLLPVAALRADPVRALSTLVDLYLDPDIASPRKVSVWYSFWGEASSRQEYFDICGKKDQRFADLVHELIGELISQTHAEQLDTDGVALGLIGVLEILWQDFAFQNETSIDRSAARRRCFAYLRSVFPQQFGATGPAGSLSVAFPNAGSALLPRLPAREQFLFQGLWQIAGHECALPQSGDFITADLVGLRALIVRDETGTIRAFRNQCGERPHVLSLSSRGRFEGTIECPIHGLACTLSGVALQAGVGEGLQPLPSRVQDGFVLVRARGSGGDSGPALAEFGGALALTSAAEAQELALAADWQRLCEHWLEFDLPEQPVGRLAGLLVEPTLDLSEPAAKMSWRARVASAGRGWSARRYATLAREHGPAHWMRIFLPPNQWLERREDGLSLLQILPVSAGQCRIRWLEYRIAGADARVQAMSFLAQRLRATWLAQDVEACESLERASAPAAPGAHPTGLPCAAIVAFRRTLAQLLRNAAMPGIQSP